MEATMAAGGLPRLDAARRRPAEQRSGGDAEEVGRCRHRVPLPSTGFWLWKTETTSDSPQLIAQPGLDPLTYTPGKGSIGCSLESLQETIVLADQPGVRGAAHTNRPRDDSPERSGEGLRRLRPAGSSAARGIGPLVAHRHSGASLPRKHRHRIVTFSPISPSDAELAVAGIP